MHAIIVFSKKTTNLGDGCIVSLVHHLMDNTDDLIGLVDGCELALDHVVGQDLVGSNHVVRNGCQRPVAKVDQVIEERQAPAEGNRVVNHTPDCDRRQIVVAAKPGSNAYLLIYIYINKDKCFFLLIRTVIDGCQHQNVSLGAHKLHQVPALNSNLVRLDRVDACLDPVLLVLFDIETQSQDRLYIYILEKNVCV